MSTSERPTVRCVYHPEDAAYAACVECFDQLCSACTRRGDDGLARCASCLGLDPEPEPQVLPPVTEPSTSVWRSPPVDTAEKIEDIVTLGGKSESPDAPGPIIPWENKVHPSDMRAFLSTVIIGIMHPINYMQQIPWRRSNLMTPLIFAVLAGMLGQVGQIARLLANPAEVEKALQSVPQMADVSPTFFVLCLLPFIPLTIVLGLFLKSWSAHILLTMINANRGPFETTFRVFAYTEVAMVLLLIPVLGPYAHKFYVVFLVLNGLREGHGAGLGAGLLALMPMLFLQAMSG